jgi:hypothetical protein
METQLSTRQPTRDPMMAAYRQRVLNGLVDERYFPEEVHGAGRRLFDRMGQAFPARSG